MVQGWEDRYIKYNNGSPGLLRRPPAKLNYTPAAAPHTGAIAKRTAFEITLDDTRTAPGRLTLPSRTTIVLMGIWTAASRIRTPRSKGVSFDQRCKTGFETVSC
ncbi:uncharacterized protein DSM5745_05757 [Aspergillus mulundensis]|uniref:Uncharacterized protein n=1 Tax=Aspergillus mulundensis TaxID=1810919 RepID=A0A3D8RXZ8_9EURO|nr:hypothetical protein DSM5745_05757 [Aspergillus mulundensis]RDW78905.1 hypothetical protein DSM5745_05757 [Aspergillus mulundensis]